MPRALLSTVHYSFRAHRLCLSATVRVFHSSPRAHHSVREFYARVPSGSNGQVLLNILEPPNARPGVVFYLPPGPVFGRTPQASAQHQDALAALTQSTVVTVNYRLGRMKPDQSKVYVAPSADSGEDGNGTGILKPDPPGPFYFPTPVHDTLAAFDWVFEQMAPEHVCLFGRHIGGALALMLALTEPRSVHAVAAEEPVCDWTTLDDYCLVEEEPNAGTPGDGQGKGQQEEEQKYGHERGHSQPARIPADLVPLLAARQRLFRTASQYFDPFASPVLLLRSPGRDLPIARMPRYRFRYRSPRSPNATHAAPTTPTTNQHAMVPIALPPTTAELVAHIARLQLLTGSAPADRAARAALRADAVTGRLVVPQTPRRRRVLARWPPVGADANATDRAPVLRAGRSAMLEPGTGGAGTAVGGEREGRAGNGGRGSLLPAVRIYIHGEGEAGEENAKQSGTEEPGTPATKQREHGYEENAVHVMPKRRRRRHPHQEHETVLARQGHKMARLMRRACFLPGEEALAEKRVQIESIPPSGPLTAETQAGEWFKRRWS